MKQKVSLVGKDLFPILHKFKELVCPVNSPFNRLKKDHPLEAYSAAELGREFEGLTGKKAYTVLGLVEKEASEENVRSLLID